MALTYKPHRLRYPRSMEYSLFILSTAAMVLVGGLRSRYIGTDTGNYVWWFDNLRDFSDIWNTSLEPGFFALSWLGHFISHNYLSVLLLVSTITVICYSWAIRKYSVNIPTSFFVLIVAGYLFISYNGARQGLAIGIYTLAIGAALRKQFWLYIGLVFIAYLFHRSVIFAVPIYFIVTRESSAKLYLLILAAGTIAVFFYDSIIGVLSAVDIRYAQYAEASEEQMGFLTLVFVCALCAFFLFFKRFITVNRELYDTLLNYFLLGTSIIVIASIFETSASGMRRMSLYFLVSEIFLWPIVLQNIGKRRRRVFLFYFASLYLVYFSLYLGRFSNLSPYEWNPVVEGWFSFFI